MTDLELEKEQQELTKTCGWHNGEYHQGTPIQEKRLLELSCIGMINSILAYGFNRDAQFVLEREEQAYHNYLKDYTDKLGRERVIELIQGQIDSIKNIKANVYTDCDGLHYNSIEWN